MYIIFAKFWYHRKKCNLALNYWIIIIRTGIEQILVCLSEFAGLTLYIVPPKSHSLRHYFAGKVFSNKHLAIMHLTIRGCRNIHLFPAKHPLEFLEGKRVRWSSKLFNVNAGNCDPKAQ